MNKVQLIKKVHFKDLKKGYLISALLPELVEKFISAQLIKESINFEPVFTVNNLFDDVISCTTVLNYKLSFEKK